MKGFALRLVPGTLTFTAFIGLLSGIGPLSTDMYLPAMPAMAAYFGTTTGAVQSTLTAYMFGYAVGQIFYGPVSDRFGRKPVLAAGLLVYVAVSLIATVVPTIELLIAARFVQALAASAPIVLGRAIIRDLYSGDQAARQISVVVAMMGIMPMIAPLVGSLLQVAFGWQAIFVVFTLLGGLAFLIVQLALPETLRRPVREPLSAAAILGGFGEIIRHRGFQAHVAMVACIYAGMFTYIIGSPFILQQHYGLGPLQYALVFGTNPLTFIVSSTVAARLIRRFGGEPVLAGGAAMLALGGLAVLVVPMVVPDHVLAFVVPMWLFMIGVGFAFSLAIAGGLTPFGHRAGSASSLIGSVQSTSAAIVVLGLSVAAAGNLLATGIVMALCGSTMLTIFLLTRRVRHAAARAAAVT